MHASGFARNVCSRVFCVGLDLSIVMLGMPGDLWHPQTFPEPEPKSWQDASQQQPSANFEKQSLLLIFRGYPAGLGLYNQVEGKEGGCVDLGFCFYWGQGWGA